MNGTALGGGLEIALACHHRIGLDAPGVVYGLPEVTLGCCPAAGGVTRITRMLGITNGFLNVSAPGPAAQARRRRWRSGSSTSWRHRREEMLDKARAWIAAERRARPRAALGPAEATGSPAARRRRPRSPPMLPAFPANLRKRSRAPRCPRRATSWPRPSRAPRSTSTPRCASRRRYFVELVTGQVAKNMTKAFFFDLQRDQRRRLAAGRVREVHADARSPCSAPG